MHRSPCCKAAYFFILTTESTHILPTALDILQAYWGHERFRPMQEDIINSVVEGNDTLALLPTGGGKSICFQVPALLKEGVCIVVSPLIALMKDQVAQLQDRGIKAEAIYSGMSYRDIDRILDNAVFGHLKFLYLSPERLQSELLKERLPNMPVNLLAVDEAHCVSQWGYDFRPPYLQIADARDYLDPSIPLIALTASATEDVIDDIQEKLAFRSASQVWRKSFSRPNLSYVVRQVEGKPAQLIDILQKVSGSAIVYVRNRRKTKELAIELVRRKIPASFYHAGLDIDERTARQEAWIKGKIRVIVATNAFGMGIDKPDVRLVVHMGLPDSLEAYFQEAGRAGRDEKRAYAVLLHNSNDRKRLERDFKQSFPELKEIKQVYRALGSYCQLAIGGGAGANYDFDLTAFAQTYKLDMYKAYHCLKVLEQAAWIAVTDAVYVSARLKIKVDKDGLYDYQLRHPKLDRILKVILRTYQGAFTHPINMKEKQLAGFLKIPVAQLRQGLQTMHQEGIVRYEPAKDQPQLIFLRDRVDADRLTIDWENYRFRKDRHEWRMKKAIGYAEKDVCRQKLLLQYFGEKEVDRCGHCDVCLARKKQAIDQQDFQSFQQRIATLIQAKAQSVQTIVAAFPAEEEETVLEVIAYLVDEGFVRTEDGQFFWVHGSSA